MITTSSESESHTESESVCITPVCSDVTELWLQEIGVSVSLPHLSPFSSPTFEKLCNTAIRQHFKAVKRPAESLAAAVAALADHLGQRLIILS